MNTIESASIIGMKMIDHSGELVGVVTETILNLDSLCISGFKVKIELEALEEMRLKEPMLGTQEVLIPAAEVANIGEVVLLKSTRALTRFAGGKRVAS